MADLADDAQQNIEDFLDKSLKHFKNKAPAFSGFCLACDEPVIARRFCDSDCRYHYETSVRPRLIIQGSLSSTA